MSGRCGSTRSSAPSPTSRPARPVVVIDDEDRENEGDLIFAAELATPELVAFMVRYTSGYICVPITEADADRLDLPPMFRINQDRRGTAYTVTVDAREGVTTGISAADRAHTIRLLADPRLDLGRLRPPRPRRAAAGQGRRRAAPARAHRGRGRPRRAGRAAPGRRAVRGRQREGPGRHGPRRRAARVRRRARPRADLDRRPDRLPPPLREAGRARRRGPRAAALRRVHRRRLLRSSYDQREHVAFVFGDIGDGEDVLVRVHSECLTGDVFGSLRCDCGPQLDAALAAVAQRGPRRRALHPRPRGPGHRPAAQAAGLPAAGRRRRHRRRQPRARPARRRPRLRHRRADPGRPRRPLDAAADQQPGQAGRPRGLRPARSPAACRCPCTPTRRTCATCRPSATGWATTLDIIERGRTSRDPRRHRRDRP